MLRIVRAGDDRREIAVHLHYYLLADILKELGQGLTEHAFLDEAHLSRLREGAEPIATLVVRWAADTPSNAVRVAALLKVASAAIAPLAAASQYGFITPFQ